MSEHTPDLVWPVQIEIPVQWGEMDALGHVNNVVYLRWFETARMDYFRRCGALDRYDDEKIGPILASTRIDFQRPVAYPDTITACARTTRVGSSSFTMSYRILGAASGGRSVAEGEGAIVMIDYGNGKSVPIHDDMRRKIEGLESSLD